MEDTISLLNQRVLAQGGNEGHTQKLVELSVELSGRTGHSTQGILMCCVDCVGMTREDAIKQLKLVTGMSGH